ncbi:MAG: DNA topoisomerase 1 [Fimbriimonadales bacterium]|nr:MAG: DNA topoisomerase 1 [Fimbriimonadales bacterium]
MPTATEKLVIVESPAKAKTISRFLGPEYRVEASIGHIRDLPERAAEIPKEIKDKPWADLAVDVENDFTPYYVIPSSKKKQVAKLRGALKEAKELYLATDEDREGESIGWHVLQVLKPKQSVPVRRIVFHEVTKEAIQAALQNPRQINENLVRAQETRRILDRLYGYSLSPLLWRKVRRNLSAGRVQSVAVRLLVEREWERIRFRSASYWDVVATLEHENKSFPARLKAVDGVDLATGKQFDPETGELKKDLEKEYLWLKEPEARELAGAAKAVAPWKVTDLTKKPFTEKPAPPFITSTLQQEANKRLGFSARYTMSLAQELYEGVDLAGERVGLITYMRTDSVTLAERAVEEIRSEIRTRFGNEYLPDKPRRYQTKTRNAQEAHEAIRPTDMRRRPEEVAKFLTKDQAALYELIYRRTLACQMKDAKSERTRIEWQIRTGSGKTLLFVATGKTVLFPGFLAAWGVERAAGEEEAVLPSLQVGDAVDVRSVEAEGHETQPPPRYTEASLVKKLEEEGIGRPSTYATIISTLLDREYAFKKGNQLVPTVTAMCVHELMMRHFPSFVDLKFTARMEDDLDDIAKAERDMVAELREFYYGTEEKPGLKPRIEQEMPKVEPPQVPIGPDPTTGEMIYARVGRYGEYIQRGEGDGAVRATLPPNTAPADLTPEQAAALLDGKEEPITTDPETGRPVYLKTGRYGAYLEVQPAEGDDGKPKRTSLPKSLKPENLDEETARKLLTLPRELGKHPESGEPVLAALGPYGPYVQHGREFRSLPNLDALFTVTLDEALTLLSQPKQGRRKSAEPIKELGEAEGCAGPIKVMKGRYGPYVTDGKTNATLPKDFDPEQVTLEQAAELIRTKAAAGPVKRRRRK